VTGTANHIKQHAKKVYKWRRVMAPFSTSALDEKPRGQSQYELR